MDSLVINEPVGRRFFEAYIVISIGLNYNPSHHGNQNHGEKNLYEEEKKLKFICFLRPH